jgi:hypothetical protein
MEEAKCVLEEFRQIGREHYISAFDLAVVHAGMGNHQEAMKSLEAAAREHAFWLISLPIEQLFDCMRGESSFDEFCKGIWTNGIN